MAKVAIFIPGHNTFLMDKGEIYIDEEREAKRVIAEDIIDKKAYEIKPMSFVKTWLKAERKKEAEAESKSYCFNPPLCREEDYTPPKGQKQFILILAKRKFRNSGELVKDFKQGLEAMNFAKRTFQKLHEEHAEYAYYIYDTKQRKYVGGLSDRGETGDLARPRSSEGACAGVRRRSKASRKPKSIPDSVEVTR